MLKKGFINKKGELECVFPGGYKDSELLDLPTDFETRGWYTWNGFAIVDNLIGWKAYITREANKKKLSILYGGCDTPFGRVDSDPDSRQILYGMQLAAFSDPSFSTELRLSDNSTVLIDAEGISSIVSSIRTMDQQAHEACVAIKTAAENATEIDENLHASS